jgi:endonuclease/exonuclease/phosphatase family metal-dependent hydrolase
MEVRLLKALIILAAAAGTVFIQAQTRTARRASAAFDIDFNAPREIRTVAPVTDLKSVRVVSWNIDRGEQLGIVASELQHSPPDLCLLQEVDWNTVRAGNLDIGSELAKRLHLNMSYAIEFEELSQERGHPAYIGQATLTRLPIQKSRVLRFQNQSGFWKPRGWLPSSLPLMQRRLGSRIALITELQMAGHLLLVYNVHFESRSYGRIQSEQLDEVLADMERYPAGTPVIIGGDLNTKYFPSIFLHKLQREGFQSATGQRIERTHAIAMALDWIFVKGPVKIEDGRVRRDFKGSDHYPIYAELVLR